LRRRSYTIPGVAAGTGFVFIVVSRGLGSVGLPWRWGADPEAMLIEVAPRD
jgi:predicted MPP superfamily phosphohydrolase